MQTDFQTLSILILQALSSVLDIAIVAIIFYFIMKIVVNSEKFIIVVNLILIFLIIYTAAILLDLETVKFLFDNIMSWIVVIVVVLFQPEIRNSIEKYARFKTIDITKSLEEEFLLDLQEEVFDLAGKKIGALITLQRNTLLSQYTKSATVIDAHFSKALLGTIFNKESPLHDGACVIFEDRITHSGVFFPIALDLNLPKEYGTRHRAGLTISRETDAITVIVSEENGNVSIAYNGKMYYNVEKEFFHEFIKGKMN